MISKEEFCKYIGDLKKYDEFDHKLYELIQEFGGYVETFELYYTVADDVIKLLSHSFESEHADWIKEEIDYFCGDLEYGAKYKPGTITDKYENGNIVIIDLSTSEKLYDYIVKTYCDK